MLLWVILACLTALVLFVLLRPLAARREASDTRAAFDAAVYRDQLDEVGSDHARGLIGEAEAEAARLEIARRLLAADSKGHAPARDLAGRGPARAAMVLVAATLPLLTLGLYLAYGSPRIPDQPLEARLKDPASDQNLAALVSRVEARLREHPEEGQGWEVIAPVYMGWRRYGDAAAAYGHAIRLLGETAPRLSGKGQALVLKNDGVVTEEARQLLERALEVDATLIEPRILLAIAKEQDGKFADAVADWRSLLATSNGSAPWREMVSQRIAQAEARLAGKPAPEAAPTPAPGARGPGAADIEAAEAMRPAERQAMIETMVDGLAARLAQESDDLPGWLKLVRAYSVLDRKDEALKALARAKGRFSGNTQALQELDRLAAELGLKS